MSNPGLAPPNAAVNALDRAYGAKGDGVTDDTTAVQAAVNAASAKASLNGLVDVWLPSGYGFKLGSILAKNNTRIWAYGATILPNLTGITNGLFGTNFGALSRFEIRGGTWLGTGSETQTQNLFEKTGSGSQLTDCRFEDLHITNWGTGPLYMLNANRVAVRRCVILNTGDTGGGLNAINFPIIGTGGANGGNDIIATDNIVEGALAGAVSYVNEIAAGSGSVRLLFARNLCTGSATNGTNPHVSGSIFLEFDIATGGPWGDFIICDNLVNNPNASASAFAMSFGVAGATFQKVKVHGNSLKATQWGIQYQLGQDIDISGNRIDAPTPFHPTGAGQPYNGTGNQLSSGAHQGRAVLVAGTITVNTAEIQAGDNVILTVVAPGGTRGEIQLGTIVAGTSFVINSIQPGTASTLQTLDTSTVFWKIEH